MFAIGSLSECMSMRYMTITQLYRPRNAAPPPIHPGTDR
jgi:hypothetical protein